MDGSSWSRHDHPQNHVTDSHFPKLRRLQASEHRLSFLNFTQTPNTELINTTTKPLHSDFVPASTRAGSAQSSVLLNNHLVPLPDRAQRVKHFTPWSTRFYSSPASVSYTHALRALMSGRKSPSLIFFHRHRNTLCSTRHRNETFLPARHVMGVPTFRKHWRIVRLLVEGRRGQTSQAAPTEKGDPYREETTACRAGIATRG
jgi:hypothetical protein